MTRVTGIQPEDTDVPEGVSFGATSFKETFTRGGTDATKTLVLTPEQVAVVAEGLCWFEDILINDQYAVAADELLPIIAQVREMLGQL